jgi:ABC-type molybdenum transport system ATPase subunit/photorepair protein PhrA/GNAT superfamily N-acetyltransferase
VKSVQIVPSARALQVEGMFDMPRSTLCRREWEVNLPIEDRAWQIGLIVGPSGSGKSTIAREMFGEAMVGEWDWPTHQGIVDGFPPEMSTLEVTNLLSSVGFSSPPSWLRPYGTLSLGEQFRVTMARTLAEKPTLAVVDEYSSVVDRRVARIASAALAKSIRRGTGQFVAVTCHEDVEAWLNPDWVWRTDQASFSWRRLRPRPEIVMSIEPASRAAWRMFRDHHYLTGSLSPAARCYLGRVEGMPAAFTAVLYWPHPKRSGWREHRTVCLPDFQGVGIGNGLSEFVAAMYRAAGGCYRSVTSSPAMIRHRARSRVWRMTRSPSRVMTVPRQKSLRATVSTHRRTASFEYVGPILPEEAKRFGIIKGA